MNNVTAVALQSKWRVHISISVIWTGKEDSSARSDRQPLLYFSFSEELASPPGGCLSVSEEKAPKTELVQVTSTNSPLNPFSKIPHEREMSLAKKLVWRELTECYTQATEQTGFWTRQKGHKQLMIEYEMYTLRKVKWHLYFDGKSPVFSFYNL